MLGLSPSTAEAVSQAVNQNTLGLVGDDKRDMARQMNVERMGLLYAVKLKETAEETLNCVRARALI